MSEKTEATKQERRCETCWLWERDGDNNHGQCRARPPTPAKRQSERLTWAIWPFTIDNEWCGEWQGKP